MTCVQDMIIITIWNETFIPSYGVITSETLSSDLRYPLRSVLSPLPPSVVGWYPRKNPEQRSGGKSSGWTWKGSIWCEIREGQRLPAQIQSRRMQQAGAAKTLTVPSSCCQILFALMALSRLIPKVRLFTVVSQLLPTQSSVCLSMHASSVCPFSEIRCFFLHWFILKRSICP